MTFEQTHWSFLLISEILQGSLMERSRTPNYSMKLRCAIPFALVFLSGCSTVGPGFKNHPGDCALGIPWSDCLPGTAGYRNGGGDLHREEQANLRQKETDKYAAIKAQCSADYQTPELDVIRHKVEFQRDSFDSSPPFEIATNDNFPSELDKVAISKWAKLREDCIERNNYAYSLPENSTPLQITFIQKDRSFFKQVEAGISDLIVALYQQRLTYGEFAKKRYELTRDASTAERQFRESTLLADQDRQIQAQQLAQQQFQNNLTAWFIYMQNVSARQPQTVHIDGAVRMQTNCNSQRFGNMVSTNCY